jgi:hypothetical protein
MKNYCLKERKEKKYKKLNKAQYSRDIGTENKTVEKQTKRKGITNDR